MELRLRLTILAVAGVMSTPALAQTIYKYRSEDGRTVYSDKVPRGTRVEKELAPESALSVIAPAVAAGEARKAESRIAVQLARREDLWRQRNQALAELQAARSAKVNGEEPLPGERSANARGGARLNDAYWARQARLDEDIERAQRNLQRAERDLREAGS